MFHRTFVLALGLALAIGVAPAAAAEPETEAANAAVAYVRTLQNPDGGFPAFGEESAPGSTIDAVFALVAAGQDPTAVTANGNSPVDYLGTEAEEYASDPGAAAKLALGVLAMGLDPTNFAGLDLMAILDANFDPATGSYGLDLFDHSFFILASMELGVGGGAPAVRAASAYLRSVQLDDGGWEFSPGFGSDSNTTALALQALLATGADSEDPAVTAGLEYVHSVQNADGGFGFLPGEESDPNSTAFAVQALVAAGEDIDIGGPWAPGGTTPLEGLRAFWNPDTGAFQFGGEDSPFATYQAVPALMLAPFPDLETRIVEVPPPASPTPVTSPTLVASPTLSPTGTSTPVREVPETIGALPSVGGGPGGHARSWWAVAALLAAGAGAATVGVAGVRLR